MTLLSEKEFWGHLCKTGSNMNSTVVWKMSGLEEVTSGLRSKCKTIQQDGQQIIKMAPLSRAGGRSSD
jgi:hypothetical protein